MKKPPNLTQWLSVMKQPMNEFNVNRFFDFLEEKAKKLAPDYPFSQKDDCYEHLWAITSSLEGANMACDDCHKIIEILRERAGMTKEELYDFWRKEIK